MGRPKKQDETIVISANGLGAAWNPQIGFLGEVTLTERAKSAARWAMVVTIHPLLEPITASEANPLGAYAALSWAAGGRDVLIQSPESVTSFLALAPLGDEDADADVDAGADAVTLDNL